MSDGLTKFGKKSDLSMAGEAALKERLDQLYAEEKALFDKHRHEAKRRLSGKGLEAVLSKLDEMERKTSEQYRERNVEGQNRQEKRRILEQRLKELRERRNSILNQAKAQELRDALKKLDMHEALLKSQIAELDIYDNPPERLPKKAGILEQMRRQKVLKDGTFEEKNEVMARISRERIERDVLKTNLHERLKDPVFRQEVMSLYQSRVTRFRFYTLFIIACFIGGVFMVRNHLYSIVGSDGFKVLFWIGAIMVAVMYVYLGKKLYKCPACDYQLDFLSKHSRDGRYMNLSNLPSCPRCGAPLR